MQARDTPLPDRSKTFTIQVDTGKVYVFVATDDIHSKLASSTRETNCKQYRLTAQFDAGQPHGHNVFVFFMFYDIEGPTT